MKGHLVDTWEGPTMAVELWQTGHATPPDWDYGPASMALWVRFRPVSVANILPGCPGQMDIVSLLDPKQPHNERQRQQVRDD